MGTCICRQCAINSIRSLSARESSSYFNMSVTLSMEVSGVSQGCRPSRSALANSHLGQSSSDRVRR